MKKIIASTIVIYMFLFFLEIGFNYFKQKHIVEYKINDFIIKEDYRGNIKNEENNYYFEIKTKENTFYLQTYENFSKKKKIIKKIEHFKNDTYECVLPIFEKNKIVTDLLCIEKGNQKNYNTIQNNEIDNFLEQTNYPKENYIENNSQIIKKGLSTFYVDNLPEKNYLAFNYYKGIKIADKTALTEIELFANDIYTQKIKTFYNNKYFIIDYNNKYESNEFILIDLKTTKKTIIGSNNKIKYDAYIQGTLNNAVYLFDKDSKSQYQIDLKDETITRIGTINSGIKYYDGTWQIINTYDAIKEEIKFKDYSQTNDYVMIKNIRGEKYGTTIYIKEVNGKYEVYESYRNNKTLIYLFTTTDYQSLNFVDDYIYYIDGINIKVYSNKTGSKKVIQDSELKNKNITIYAGE